ncbi:hypothetical protein SLS56_007968 [Neofusicoccum ribis]|uniref:Uncharacterized protein n=1 Tax=Neofusicoccum ribis TaxID=45134 RepID=A0ABR3SM40_9PEZI
MSDTAPSRDLSLPSYEPALLKDYVPETPAERAQEIASMSQQDWEDVEMETQLVRPVKPTLTTTSNRLVDVVRTHAAIDMEVTPPRSSGTSDIGWLPHCFVVITNNKLDDHGLLLVYADDTPNQERNTARIDNFFFAPEKMFELLSGLFSGTHGV